LAAFLKISCFVFSKAKAVELIGHKLNDITAERQNRKTEKLFEESKKKNKKRSQW
jgi:hypothetical protein